MALPVYKALCGQQRQFVGSGVYVDRNLVLEGLVD
jgi:hypothetical protein